MAEAPSPDGPVTGMAIFGSRCKPRGFVFQSSEIYGGIGGFWDYGPLGVELKNNIKRDWWRAVVQERADVVGLESSIIMKPRVGHASGPRIVNLIFKTFIGPVADDASVAYLRPETAQGMFVNFDNVLTAMRRKLPFGIAQIGRSFRNEITPGNFIFRDRELEQMEMEFFIHPTEEDRWFAYWVDERHRWWTDVLGIDAENLRLRPHDPDELSHYSRQTTDIEYRFPI